MPAPSAAAAATTSATGIPRPMPGGSPSGPILLRYAAASREKGARMPDVPLTWLGHASFRLDTPGGKRIYVDPFLSGNPKCPDSEKDPERMDVIALTHGHSDHVGDTVELAKRFDPEIVANVELKGWLGSQGADVGEMPGPNKGGTVEAGGGPLTPLKGVPSDYSPDVAVLPIGGHFTMDPREAAVALELLGTKRCIPCHYGTFPLLAGTPDELREQAPDVELIELEPGETTTV